MRNRILYLLIPLITSLVLASPSNAAQHGWGASYLNWSGALLSSESRVTQILQPLELSPNMYWEAGWNWDNATDGGYGGVQTQGNLADGRISDLAIFSIWNAKGAIPGEGAGCTKFGGEGIGYSCRIPISLVAGNKYEISFGIDPNRGSNWWLATIADLANGTKQVIGSIEANQDHLRATGWNNFIEYWGQAVPCDQVGKASAKFSVPWSDNPKVEFSSPRFSRPQNPCVMSAGDTPPPGTIGDAVIRFGGATQAPSTQDLPFTLTKSQAAAEQAAAEAAESATKAASERDLAIVQGDTDKLLLRLASLKKLFPFTKEISDLEKKFKTIHLVLGSDLSIVKSNISSVNTKLDASEKIWAKTQKMNLLCVKGKLQKLIVAVQPKCPAGYKKK